MPFAISKEQLIKILSASSSGGLDRINCSGVVTDSREIKGGELFVALQGESTHGHQFVKSAYDRGASMLLVATSEPFSGVDPERIIVVKDTLAALSQLASWWRSQLTIPVLGVTGSVGKTTTKEICAAILLANSRGSYSRKSYNNHVGVPLSILAVGRESEWAVIEMGMNHAGEISELSKLTKPTVALITAIAPAHIENLGSIENIVKAKLEIADGLSESGTLVLNSDSDILIQGAKANKSSKPTRYFGTREFADVKLIKVDGRGIDGISVEIEFNEERPAPFSIPIMGKHNGMNVAAAILASKLLVPDISWETIRVGLSRFVAPDMRLRRYPTCSGMEIVDDSYNANPESMRAMLTIADETAKQGRKVGLVLGDMLELGDISEDAHREVGKIAVDMTPEFIAAVGPQSKVIAVESSRSGINTYWFNEVEEAVSNCGLFECDVLFVKASRGTGLDRLVKALAF